MSENREVFLIAVIGHNRTGKTVTAKQLIESWKQTHDGEVITFDPQKRLVDLTDREILASDDDWALELYESKPINSLIVLDDYRILMDNDKTDKNWMNILNYRAEWCNDIIIIMHNPKLLLERIAYFVTHYIIFYTVATDKSFNRQIVNVETLIEASAMINEYARDNGRGEYPTFPFVVFDMEKSELYPVNFNT